MLTEMQEKYLRHGIERWFTPAGRGWAACDALVRKGLLEHNNRARHCGEQYRTTEAGISTLAKSDSSFSSPGGAGRTHPAPSPEERFELGGEAGGA